HRFSGDSQVQATFYNTNIYNKIYSTVAPLGFVGTGGIDPGFLTQAEQVIRGICGQGFDVNGGIGVSAATNLAHVRAQGLEVSGRQRVIRQVALDYDYGATSVVLVSAPPALLSSNGTLIVGSQIPRVPVHQYNLGLNYEFAHSANFRLGYHHVSDNNSKNLGPYGYADLLVAGNVGRGRLAVGVNNLFNAQAFDYGLINQGVPLAQNHYATGVQPTERFGLPYRSITFTYTLATQH
ncbi:MAG: TonB-dependent receptor, partial [Candidatus Eremiobacteraeota bacterium]|nr:TonB-dependent receptor [Candidatus Eremiobacteraeota bacterium]